ncbi:NfeD family protein [Kerstersia sp.]|uniref:NfeD family protein n=1 Tax=Kerstersia sp. TaxID=1930783 RepID=UPI003F933E61
MWYWFGLAALTLIGEVMSGTFYLLLATLGLLGAGLVTWLGAGFAWQLLVFALVSLAGLMVLRRFGILRRKRGDPGRNVNLNLDIGQVVEVQAWTEQGTARVNHRGAQWDAVPVDPAAARVPGPHRIIALDGTRLVLAPLA